jgi:hypothetical protein
MSTPSSPIPTTSTKADALKRRLSNWVMTKSSKKLSNNATQSQTAYPKPKILIQEQFIHMNKEHEVIQQVG